MKILTKKDLSSIDGFTGYEEETSNFAIAFMFLPKKARTALSNFYVLCSYLDDIVDEPTTADDAIEQKSKRINFWRDTLAKMYATDTCHEKLIPLKETLLGFNIPLAHIECLIDGVAQDLHKNRYSDIDELYQYCYGVASIVGIVCLYFFGDHSDKAINYAVNLGYALQLTNIMRDVAGDAKRNYIYIPQNIIQKHAYTEEELMSDSYSPAFINIMSDLAIEAQKCYDKADLALSECDSKKPFLASQIMRAVYYRLFKKIIRKDYQVFTNKVRLNKFEKLLAVAKTLFA